MYKCGPDRVFIKVLICTCLALAMAQPLAAVDDPTMPAYLRKPAPKKVIKAKPRKPQKPLSVSSILVSPDRSVAIINNKVVTRGDVVDNARVVDIQRNKVVVKRNGKSLTLGFDKAEVVRKSYR